MANLQKKVKRRGQKIIPFLHFSFHKKASLIKVKHMLNLLEKEKTSREFYSNFICVHNNIYGCVTGNNFNEILLDMTSTRLLLEKFFLKKSC